MRNPISKNRNYLLAYFAIWITIFLIQTFIINFFYGVESMISLTDSAVFNMLFALIGLNLWYVIRFNLKETPNIFDLLFNHLIIIVLTIGAWMSSNKLELLGSKIKRVLIQN